MTFWDKTTGVNEWGRRIRWKPTLVVGGVLLLYVLAMRPVPTPEGWGTDLDAAMSESAATGRNVLIAFYSPGCPPCAAMDRSVLNTDVVIEAMKDFAAVRVGLYDQLALAERVGATGTPTFAVIDPDGNLIASCVGYQPADRFVRFLQRSSTAESKRRVAPAAPHQPVGP